jgi:hypothetical protein
MRSDAMSQSAQALIENIDHKAVSISSALREMAIREVSPCLASHALSKKKRINDLRIKLTRKLMDLNHAD